MKRPPITEASYKKSYPDIEKVIWNKPATVVFLKTGEKGISKVQRGDKWNKELGFWVAYARAMQEKDKPYRKLVNTFNQACRMVELGLKIQAQKGQQFKRGALISRVGERGPETVLTPNQIKKLQRGSVLNLSGLK